MASGSKPAVTNRLGAVPDTHRNKLGDHGFTWVAEPYPGCGTIVAMNLVEWIFVSVAVAGFLGLMM